MADTQYITANNLKDSSRQTKGIILAVGVPAAVVFIALFPQIWFFALLLVFVPFLNFGTTEEFGAKGEDATLEILKQLPDSYTLFNQVKVPNEESRDGTTELDFIVVGPNGVFAVEVKHNNSTIYGNETAKEWRVLKIGRGGTPYTKIIRNPVKQVKKQIWALSSFLKAKKHKVWVEGMVFLSNPNSRLEFEGESSIPIIQQNGLVEHIQNCKPRYIPSDIQRVIRNIAEIKKG